MTTALLALAIGQASRPPLIETLTLPTAPAYTVQAVIRAPFPLKAREQAAWMILGAHLLKGTKDFTSDSLMAFGSQAGVAPRASVSPDSFRVVLQAPLDGLDVAASLMESVLMTTRVNEDTFRAAAAELQGQEPDAWKSALLGISLDYSRVRPSHVADLASQTFQPENIQIIVSGPLERGQAALAFAQRFRSWTSSVRRGAVQFDADPAKVESLSGSLTVAELRGQPIVPGRADFGAKLAAVAALGCGKDSSVFRVLREQLLLSYRQEVVLWLTRQGWQPRILLIRRAGGEGESELPKKMREALLADVKSWNEDTLQRARAMARASLGRESAFSPFWADASGPAAAPSDLPAVSAVARAPMLTQEALMAALESADLEQVKQAASTMLSGMEARLLAGRTAGG